MLQRHVHVLDEARMRGDGVQQFLRDAIRIAIEKAHPNEIFDWREAVEEQREAIAQAEIFPIRSGVLADECHLADTGARQLLGFADDGFKPAAAEFPRSCGMMQKLHGWSQPSAILM